MMGRTTLAKLRVTGATGALALALVIPGWRPATAQAAQDPAGAAAQPAGTAQPSTDGTPAVPGQGRRRRTPPPAVTPVQETAEAQKRYTAGDYNGAVTQAKVALTKNDKYTPAMLVMAKAYYKLRKHEWVRHLWKMMQANNATQAEQAEMYHLLAWMEIEKKNVPGAIDMLKKAADARPENPVLWNNLGAQYLEAKNYRDAAPALEKAVELNPSFAKAFLNLGSAYRGLREYDRAAGSYQKALQLFPNYADAVFHLGILYLDADKVPNMDTIAKLNTALGHFQRYKQMMGNLLARGGDPVDTYVAEAHEKIGKEQKRIERAKAQAERERQRAAQKAAEAAKPAETPPAEAKPGEAKPADPKPPEGNAAGGQPAPKAEDDKPLPPSTP
jgi:Flp pilus assembly protein TadD